MDIIPVIVHLTLFLGQSGRSEKGVHAGTDPAGNAELWHEQSYSERSRAQFSIKASHSQYLLRFTCELLKKEGQDGVVFFSEFIFGSFIRR